MFRCRPRRYTAGTARVSGTTLRARCDQAVHRAGPHSSQHDGAGPEGGAARRHVIDQQDPRRGTQPTGRHEPRTGHPSRNVAPGLGDVAGMAAKEPPHPYPEPVPHPSSQKFAMVEPSPTIGGRAGRAPGHEIDLRGSTGHRVGQRRHHCRVGPVLQAPHEIGRRALVRPHERARRQLTVSHPVTLRSDCDSGGPGVSVTHSDRIAGPARRSEIRPCSYIQRKVSRQVSTIGRKVTPVRSTVPESSPGRELNT